MLKIFGGGSRTGARDAERINRESHIQEFSDLNRRILQHQYQRINSESKTQQDAMGASTGQRLSGMQKQVLSLYRGFLRAARTKSHEERHKIESIVSEEFRRNSKEVDRKHFLYIEYLLRRGKKQLDQLRNPGTTGLSSLEVDLSKTNKINP